MVHATDWFPTLLSAAGLEYDEDIDGVDQWEKIKDPSLPNPRQEMLYNHFLPVGNSYLGIWDELDTWPPFAAIRVGDWKYIWREYGFDGWSVPSEQGPDEPGVPVEVRHQLYNLASDPLEKENLSEVEPEMAEMLLNKLEAIYEKMGPDGNFSYPASNRDGLPVNHGGIWTDGWC